MKGPESIVVTIVVVLPVIVLTCDRLPERIVGCEGFAAVGDVFHQYVGHEHCVVSPFVYSSPR